LVEVKKKSGLKVLSTRGELEDWRRSLTLAAGSAVAGKEEKPPLIGFVPTMGALHHGHMSLIREARQKCQNVIVSIFVNPLQFAPNEDFAKYPRTFEKDRQMCEEVGVDVIFHPTVDVMYPGGQEGTTRVIPPPVLEKTLYGIYRPPFFSGVATVVNRLFNLVQPQVAFFGEKDYQQLLVIKKMVFDLQMPVEIIGCETVREPDGLASSSRNVFLDEQQRNDAPLLQKTLQEIKAASLKDPNGLVKQLEAGQEKISQLPNVDLKYLVACNAETLEELTIAGLPMVLLVAAKFKEVWLIDTLVVREQNPPDC
jgi:pantoate--beta-alanine ligase